MSVCDNRAVFVLVRRPGAVLMLKRREPPPGWAGIAGHLDDHGLNDPPFGEDDPLWPWKAAAMTEMEEEAGLTVTKLSLLTPEPVWRHNACGRRVGPRGIGHDCMLFEADVAGDLNRSKRETLDLRWMDLDELDERAQHTIAYAHGKIPDKDFDGIELVWMRWFRDHDVIPCSTRVLNAIESRLRRRPWVVGAQTLI